jgi:type I restriction enzyme, R subunit
MIPSNQMLTEADTCRKYVVPKLQGAGWDNKFHTIAKQRFFTDGPTIVRGSEPTHWPVKKADHLLRYASL